ncbi:hypothetical protein [Nesterenkonia xinjiangensis]|uniref:Lipoprotein n=1 Tax=Nesterenkonia xinjiangensis TaxID=225327 RepID=A0A7Z0KB52_9MICC|nr:hypothetical protein [Nesterenkonia xinjiangensis]NYJ78950.1 hypothetical protein [Nesterenkonia xinjiangensis]
MNAVHRAPCAALVASAVLGALLTGCSTKEEPEHQGVALEPDFPSYDTSGLVGDADAIVTGTVTASEAAVLTPDQGGESAEANPLMGLSEEERRHAMEEGGVPATAFTLAVDTVAKGDIAPGDDVVVIQTGGVVDGVTHEAAGVVLMSAGTEYLIFAGEGPGGTFHVLGGPAGLYQGTADSFEQVSPEAAPFDEIPAADVETLADGP